MTITVSPGELKWLFSGETTVPSFAIAIRENWTPVFSVTQEGNAKKVPGGYLVPVRFNGCEPGWTLNLYLNNVVQVWQQVQIVPQTTTFALRSAHAMSSEQRTLDFCVPIEVNDETVHLSEHAEMAALRFGPGPKQFTVTEAYSVSTGAALPSDIWSLEDPVSGSGHVLGGDLRYLRIGLRSAELLETWLGEQAEDKKQERFAGALAAIKDAASGDCSASDYEERLLAIESIVKRTLKPRATRLVHALLSAERIALVIQAALGPDDCDPVQATVFLDLCTTTPEQPDPRC